MQVRETSDHQTVLIDPALLADLHHAGWRGAVSPDAALTLGVAAPMRPDRYAPKTRKALEDAIRIPTLQHVLLPDVISLLELDWLEKFLSYEERLLLALARGTGCQVAAQEKPLIQHAEKLLGRGRVLSRESLISSAGLVFDAEAVAQAEMATLWKLWDDAGQAATKRARADLHAQGIGFVSKIDGTIVETMPDGSVRPLSESR